MSHSRLPDDWSVLLNNLADDALTSEQEEELVRLLRTDAEFRQEYVRFCQLVAQLTWQCSSESESKVQQTLGTSSHEIPLKVPVNRDRATGITRPFIAIVRWLVTAAVIVIGVIWLAGHQFGDQPVGQLTDIAGQVDIIRGETPVEIRPEVLATNPVPLHGKDRVRTGQDGSATLMLADRSEIRIRPDSEFLLPSGQPVPMTLQSGSLLARVTPQDSGRSLTFTTGNADVQVLGTELEILATPLQSEVAVSEGKVRVTRIADGASAEVSTREFLSITASGPLSVIQWPQAPDQWSEDFEKGLPKGWTGRLVPDGLPANSRGAVASEPVQQTLDSMIEIRSPLKSSGLFAWHDNSAIHLTYCVQPPGWFHIYLFTRSYQDSTSLQTYCYVNPDLWQRAAGEWRTERIPLSEFRLVATTQNERTLGRIPVRIAFSGKSSSAGIVIDSVSVDRTRSVTGARK